jgi:hypothetical protein
MFKRNSLNALFAILPFLATAQTDKDYEMVAEGTCNCAAKKDLKRLTKDEATVELGLCMLSALEVLSEEARKKFDFTNTEKAHGLGEKIGLKMVVKCPKVMSAIVPMLLDDDAKTPATPEPLKVEGKVKQVIEGDYVTVVLVDHSGREHKLIWADHFAGEAPFIANPQDLKDKKVAIGYQSVEKYVPKMHDYYSIKQIVQLEVQ